MIIGHNLDVIKKADYIVDLGSEVGDGGKDYCGRQPRGSGESSRELYWEVSQIYPMNTSQYKYYLIRKENE